MTLTPARYRELADRMEQRAAELDEFPFDAYQDTAKLLREAVATLRALAEEGERTVASVSSCGCYSRGGEIHVCARHGGQP
jgi:hypothetical protein